jgi:hypothetical protein
MKTILKKTLALSVPASTTKAIEVDHMKYAMKKTPTDRAQTRSYEK